MTNFFARTAALVAIIATGTATPAFAEGGFSFPSVNGLLTSVSNAVTGTIVPDGQCAQTNRVYAVGECECANKGATRWGTGEGFSFLGTYANRSGGATHFMCFRAEIAAEGGDGTSSAPTGGSGCTGSCGDDSAGGVSF